MRTTLRRRAWLACRAIRALAERIRCARQLHYRFGYPLGEAWAKAGEWA